MFDTFNVLGIFRVKERIQHLQFLLFLSLSQNRSGSKNALSDTNLTAAQHFGHDHIDPLLLPAEAGSEQTGRYRAPTVLRLLQHLDLVRTEIRPNRFSNKNALKLYKSSSAINSACVVVVYHVELKYNQIGFQTKTL